MVVRRLHRAPRRQRPGQHQDPSRGAGRRLRPDRSEGLRRMGPTLGLVPPAGPNREGVDGTRRADLVPAGHVDTRPLPQPRRVHHGPSLCRDISRRCRGPRVRNPWGAGAGVGHRRRVPDEARPGFEHIGWARRMLDLALESGGGGVGLRARLAEASVDIEVARLLSYRSIWPGRDSAQTRRQASIAKLISSEVFQRVAETAINMMGLRGQGTGRLAQSLYLEAAASIHLPWNLRSTPDHNFRLGSPFYPLSLDGRGLG